MKHRFYLVLELKVGKFKPEYLGKLSFYLTAIDKEIKLADDNPMIGLLLCQSSNKLMVEYCLSDMRKPIGVSEYKATAGALPHELENVLPTQEQFQHLKDTLPPQKEEDE